MIRKPVNLSVRLDAETAERLTEFCHSVDRFRRPKRPGEHYRSLRKSDALRAAINHFLAHTTHAKLRILRNN